MRTPGCKAYGQASNQMHCAVCSLTWDGNDPEPPPCKKNVGVIDAAAQSAVETDNEYARAKMRRYG